MHSNCGISLRQPNIDANILCIVYSLPIVYSISTCENSVSFGSNTFILENTNVSMECSFEYTVPVHLTGADRYSIPVHSNSIHVLVPEWSSDQRPPYNCFTSIRGLPVPCQQPI